MCHRAERANFACEAVLDKTCVLDLEEELHVPSGVRTAVRYLKWQTTFLSLYLRDDTYRALDAFSLGPMVAVQDNTVIPATWLIHA